MSDDGKNNIFEKSNLNFWGFITELLMKTMKI